MEIFEKISFYRGMSNKYPIDMPYIVTPRKNRKPLNTDDRFHFIVDNWFYKKFGFYFRSQSVFLTTDKEVARTYAYNNSYQHIVRVIPLTPYNYCWSPKIEDLFTLSHDHLYSREEEIESILESLEYKDTNLIETIQIPNEIMLVCNQYLAIPIMLDNIE